jgi:transposase
VAAEPDRYELHHQDETQTIPAAGTNRRLTVFGSVAVVGRGRVEVLGAGQTSADFLAYLDVLEQRHRALNKEIVLVLDNGPCHQSKISAAALAARADWLHVLWLPKYCPQLNKKEREWRYLKRDARGHLVRTRRAFADGVLAGLARLGGARLDIVDRVPDWFLAGHRKPPTGRPPGRPTGSKDSSHRTSTRRTNLPAAT